MNLAALVPEVGISTWIEPITALVAAFVFGQVLAWVYERTYVGLSYSRGFGHTVVLVCLSAAILVQAMQHSLMAGLGLFGVLSMIRFRTDLKTPRDLVFVMGSACVGVAAGAGAWVVAGVGSAAFAAVVVYLAAGPFGSRARFDGVLRFNMSAAPASEPTLERLLGEFCRRAVLLSTSEIGTAGQAERVYQVKLFSDVEHGLLLQALRDDLDASDTRLLLQDSTSEY